MYWILRDKQQNCLYPVSPVQVGVTVNKSKGRPTLHETNDKHSFIRHQQRLMESYSKLCIENHKITTIHHMHTVTWSKKLLDKNVFVSKKEVFDPINYRLDLGTVMSQKADCESTEVIILRYCI